MPALLIATVRVDDTEAYKKYTALTPDIVAKYPNRTFRGRAVSLHTYHLTSIPLCLCCTLCYSCIISIPSRLHLLLCQSLHLCIRNFVRSTRHAHLPTGKQCTTLGVKSLAVCTAYNTNDSF